MHLTELAFFTADVPALRAFYAALLGTAPVAESEQMAIFMVGMTKIFIHATYTPQAGELPPTNHMAFTVEDVEATCQTLAARGLTLEVPPRNYYWGRSAYLRDPEGLLIEVTQTAPPANDV